MAVARTGALLAVLWLLLPALLAGAAELEKNEPLVMRIIFEDCLGYVRAGRTPFGGLPTGPATAEAIRGLPLRMPDRERAVQLLSPRYVASWGEDENGRHCYVGSDFAAGQVGAPGLLGVPAKGFLGRVTARAAAEGMTEAGVADGFSPLATSYWSEPGTGAESGPARPVRFTLLATTAPDARGIAEAGLILMAGPPGRR
ncbi:hypothetical protein [Roseomonas populi]|uniref:Uncharacterized protein n=1 Tax=Roseomonas populi TaxID=3121582 RepID=A0ABT1XD74_9PROT|nr:hypothetical protein [Roseomonas pecuniae]MCR0985067.1 hypothetical protein [Roseomonas pecuniae]